MATPQPHELGIYYTSKDLMVDNAAVPDRVAGDQSTILNIHVPALNNPTDFWNGATGVFVGENTTISLRGHFFHVRKWDNATKMLAIAQPLPTLPAAGDTFKLMAGGRTASGLEVFGMKIAGKQPELGLYSEVENGVTSVFWSTHTGDYEGGAFGLWFSQLPPIDTNRSPDQTVQFASGQTDYFYRLTQSVPLWLVIMPVKGSMFGQAAEIFLNWSDLKPRRPHDQTARNVYLDENLPVL